MTNNFFKISRNTPTSIFKNLSQTKQHKFKEKLMLVNHSETMENQRYKVSLKLRQGMKEALYYWDE